MTQETKSKAEEKREKQEVVNDVIAVLAIPAGRRYIWRLLEKARVFRTPYAGQTNLTFLNLGQQNLGLQIFTELLDASPELFLQMQKEHYILTEPDSPAEEKSK